jgi:hypothetical protein
MSSGQTDRRMGGRADGRLAGALAIVIAGCAPNIPVEVRTPQPRDVLLQVWTHSTCLEIERCPSTRRRGSLVFADHDSLVMFDVVAMERVAIRPGPGVVLEVYRGQRTDERQVMNAVGKGALAGAAAGLGEAVLVGGILKLLGGDVDLTDAMRGGVAFGAGAGALSGALKAADEGVAVWERVSLLQLRQQLCRCPDPRKP